MLKISQLGRSREEEKKQRIVQWYRSCESTWDHCPYHKGTIEERVNTRRAPTQETMFGRSQWDGNYYKSTQDGN